MGAAEAASTGGKGNAKITHQGGVATTLRISGDKCFQTQSITFQEEQRIEDRVKFLAVIPMQRTMETALPHNVDKHEERPLTPEAIAVRLSAPSTVS